MRTTVTWLVAMVIAAGCGVETIYTDMGGPVSADRGRDAEPGSDRSPADDAEERIEFADAPDAADPETADVARMDEGGKPDGCIPCTPDKIAGKERFGCRIYTCEGGCLVEGWFEFMGACGEPERCLRPCSPEDTRPECGVCICDDADCNSKSCVSANLDARAEPDQDGCKADQPCRTSVCEQVEKPDGGKAWECVEGPDMPDGMACSDGNSCTLETTCQEGECLGTPMDCDDGNPCTDDRCEEPGACRNEVKDQAPCDDGDPCTDSDHCGLDGSCHGVPKSCVPTGPCFRAWCQDGTCLEEPIDGGDCNDGDPCTLADTCLDGTCVGHPMVCEPEAPCLTARAVQDAGVCRCLGAVNPGWCFFQISGQGVCVEVGQTDPSGCFECVASQEVTPKFLTGRNCEDGDPCTVGDLCSPTAKRCAGTPVLVDPEPLPCQHPACDGHTPVVGVATDDGWCVHDAKCYPEGSRIGQCRWCGKDGGVWKVLHVNSGTPCEDGNPCTSGDACDNEGQCRGGWAYACEPPAGGCATVSCDGEGGCSEPEWISTSGECLVKSEGRYLCLAPGQSLPGMTCVECNPALNPFGLVPATPGWPCDTLDCCRQGGVCDGQGNCIAGPPAPCDDGNPCTLDYCVTADCPGFPGAPPACGHKPTSGPKPCQASCGQAGTCVNGLCQTPLPCNPCPAGKCDDGDPCTDDSCDQVTGSCEHAARDCDDHDPCTTDRCDAGQCVHDPVDCDDGDPCTEDACDPASGECAHQGMTGPACDDHNACTTNDLCEAGVCRGTAVECPWSGHECYAPVCDPAGGACVESTLPDGSGCEDGNPCNARDQCLAGTCLGLGTCGGAVVLFGSQLVTCDPVPLLGQTLTLHATARWDDPSGPGAFQTIASLVGQDINGKAHGLEFLVGTATSPSAAYCAPARRLVLRVFQHGQSFLVSYAAQAKVPVGEWTLLAVTVGSGGVTFAVGSQVIANAIRCDTGAAIAALDLPQVPALQAHVGGVPGPDGSVTTGARMTVSDLTVWDVVVPPGPPSYTYPNLWCLFVEETAFEHHEVRPVLALRFNYEDLVLIDEGHARAACRHGSLPEDEPVDPSWSWSDEPFRTGCPD